MKRILPLFLALLSLAVSAHADAVGDFQTRVRAEYLRPFARDLGGLMGSATAHQGRTLGFPGFWVGGVAATQVRPDKDDRILRDSGVKSFGLPMLEAQVG